MFQAYVKASWAMYDKLSKALLKFVVIMTQQVFYHHFFCSKSNYSQRVLPSKFN